MKNNLEKIREERKLSRAQLAKLADSAYSTIYNFEKGITDISEELLKRLGEVLKVPSSQIATPETGDLLRESSESNGILTRIDRAIRRLVPVISWARAGEMLERGINYGDLEGQIDEMVETDCRDLNAFALIVEGDSMYPMYLPGDRVVFAPNEEPRTGDIVVARHNDTGKVYFKKFRRTGPDGTAVVLESVNQDYKNLEFKEGEFRFIYPAVDMVRKIRR